MGNELKYMGFNAAACLLALVIHEAAASLPLKPILHIDWERLPKYPAQGPEGSLGSAGGWVDADTVLSAFGYFAGGDFSNTSWVLNTSVPNRTWKQIPSAPVSPRQDVASAKVGSSFYFLGGFSYTKPFTYKDALRLTPINKAPWWEWDRLP